MSAYTQFVKHFFAQHRGRASPQQLMKMCAAAWRSHRGGRIIATGEGFRHHRKRRVGMGVRRVRRRRRV